MKFRSYLLSAAVTAVMSLSVTAFAQGPPDPGDFPPPPDGQAGPPPGQGRGPGGPGGPGMRRGPMAASLAHTPVSVLASNLKLTDDQKSQIQKIHEDMEAQRRSLMPRPDDQNGEPPDRETMRANFEKMRASEQKANTAIEAILTDDQKTQWQTLKKDITLFHSAELPIELISDLKLTDDQKKQIADIVTQSHQSLRQKMEEAQQNGDRRAFRAVMQQAHQQMHAKILATLTADQQDRTEKYIQAHPQRRQGFPGGGPPGGGPPDGGGPPPPDGADGGGPPPPPDGQ